MTVRPRSPLSLLHHHSFTGFSKGSPSQQTQPYTPCSKGPWSRFSSRDRLLHPIWLSACIPVSTTPTGVTASVEEGTQRLTDDTRSVTQLTSLSVGQNNRGRYRLFLRYSLIHWTGSGVSTPSSPLSYLSPIPVSEWDTKCFSLWGLQRSHCTV